MSKSKYANDSQLGTKWITNGKETKKIKAKDADLYVNDEWYLGRTMPDDFTDIMSRVMSGKKYSPRSEEHTQKQCEAQLGRIPWNKGKSGIFSDETIKRMRDAKLGKKRELHSIETKNKISNTLLGHTVLKETKEKLSKTHTGKILSKEHRNNIGKAGIGRVWSKESKEKLRTSIIQYILTHGGAVGNTVGINEQELLNNQEKIDKCKIDRKFNVLIYKPDGYCHETNTIYEVYEKYHDKQVREDLKRENEICNYLNCDFVIIYDRTH